MSNLARQLEQKKLIDRREIQEPQRQGQQFPIRKKPISKGEKTLYMLTLIGVVFATYLVLSAYASTYIANKEIHQLQTSINEQVQKNEALRLQVTELSAPDRILKIATEELGMTLNDQNVRVVRN